MINTFGLADAADAKAPAKRTPLNNIANEINLALGIVIVPFEAAVCCPSISPRALRIQMSLLPPGAHKRLR
jgi:hypothetical protein